MALKAQFLCHNRFDEEFKDFIMTLISSEFMVINAF